MDNPNLHIIDDGTLDTVVACAACDWEGRYNPEFDTDVELDNPHAGRAGRALHAAYLETAREDRRVGAALTMAADDHDCGPELAGPLN